jgi:predicted Ser/Thr protein kinase
MDSDADATTRRCSECGELFSGPKAATHGGCKGTSQRLRDWAASTPGTSRPPPDNTLMSGEVARAARRPEDDYPPDVIAAMRDPRMELNQYVLVQQVGRGGMGAVWRAFDRKLLRWVAIKFLLEQDDEGTRRFTREAQIAARLRHPNIAAIYEVGDARGQPFIAMDFIEGASLDKERMAVRDVLEIFVKVCEAVHAAHQAGVVHRDLKPQNVMLTRERWPFVMDFGLAKALRGGSSLSVSGTVLGTPAFMPPEQAGGRINEVDERSDVYSLGATLYAVLTREHPFQGQGAMEVLVKVCHEDLVPPRKYNPEIPVEIETILMKAMAKEKSGRYDTAAAMGADLRRYLEGQLIEAKRPGTIELLARRVRRNAAPFIAIAALIAGIVVTALFMSRPSHEERWLKAWIELRNRLTYSTWDGSDAGLAARAHDHLVRAGTEATIRDGDAALEWVGAEIDRVARETDPRKASQWLRMMEKVAEGFEPAKRAAAARAEAERRAAIAAWDREWEERRGALDFDTFAEGDLDGVKRALAAMPADKAGKTEDWLRQQAAKAREALKPVLADPKSWINNRALATRVAAWCSAAAAASAGIGALKEVSTELLQLQEDAQRVANYRGRITLKIAAAPWAEASVTVDGRDVAKRPTPAQLKEVEIGEIRVTLSHPDHAAKSVAIEASRLKDGKTYVVSGSMKSGDLSVTEE